MGNVQYMVSCSSIQNVLLFFFLFSSLVSVFLYLLKGEQARGLYERLMAAKYSRIRVCRGHGTHISNQPQWPLCHICRQEIIYSSS